jgi:TolA-binding protein
LYALSQQEVFKMKKFLFAALVLNFVGCKTTEEIRREQMVDNISLQMVQSQQMTAEATVKLNALEERLGLLTGQVEVQEYQTIQETQKELTQLKERMGVIENQNRSTQSELERIQSQLNEQKKFMDELMKTLSTLTEKKSAPSSAAKSASAGGSLYEQAMEDYQRGRYPQSKAKLEQLLNNNQVKGNQRSRTLHNLGMIAWMDKQDDKAQVYFSRLLTEHADSPQVRNGMLFLGKSFHRAKQSNEAKQVLQELIKRFPDANQVKEAKTLLAKL